jgi:hypothetical protein
MLAFETATAPTITLPLIGGRLMQRTDERLFLKGTI